MNRHAAYLVCVALLGSGCEPDPGLSFPGTTEWDRVVVRAEASEPVLDWQVAEGERVGRGDLLLRLDGDRFEARILEAKARLAEAEARLAELRAGPRPETIDRARAELASTQAAVTESELEYERVAELLSRGLAPPSNADQALAARDQRRAAVAAARAVLDELLAGTRPEQIDQAQARVSSIQAEISELRLTRDRLDVHAPRAGRIDALPFKPGDQPKVGDVLASLLVGDTPIARVFIPASVRARFAEGDIFDIRVEGVAESFRARLRSIRSEPSFTPYYALTGDDATRIVYRAELLFVEPRAADLPAGLPVIATPANGPDPDG